MYMYIHAVLNIAPYYMYLAELEAEKRVHKQGSVGHRNGIRRDLTKGNGDEHHYTPKFPSSI